MYYRKTKMQFDPSKHDDLYAYVDGIRDELKTLGTQSL